MQETIYQYDNKRKLVSERVFDNKHFIYEITYQYDKSGKVISNEVKKMYSKCSKCPMEGKTTYLYDNQVFLKGKFLKSGKYLVKTFFRRDKSGHLLEEESHYNLPEKSIALYTYSNDLYGNWISRKVYHDDVLFDEESRKITYY